MIPHRVRGATLSALVAAVLTPAAALDAQAIPWSQKGGVTQRVGYTDIEVTYNRPVARGRELFGGVVRWGRVWNAGADSATTIAFSRAVEINGHALASGAYTFWAIPAERGPWTVIFSSRTGIYHTPYPGEEYDALRFEVMPERGAHMEVMAFYFPEVTPESAVLRLHWGTTVIPLTVHAPWQP